MSFIKSYKWLLPSLLFSISLVLVRIICTGRLTFAFLTWNLFLAIIPLYMTYQLGNTSVKVKQYMYAGIWLLFFPNSMYIVTDLFHLRDRGDLPLWYDLLTLLSFACNGVIMGFLSLYKIEKWMAGFLARKYLSAIIFLLLLLCGYGIYLGRYERWNSWDILLQPFSLLANIGSHIWHPFRNINTWILSTAFAVWMYLLYKHLLRISGR